MMTNLTFVSLVSFSFPGPLCNVKMKFCFSREALWCYTGTDKLAAELSVEHVIITSRSGQYDVSFSWMPIVILSPLSFLLLLLFLLPF
jgi:hypothetical protein